jgi:putative oxidoreductase
MATKSTALMPLWQPLEDLTLLLLRAATGIFLVYGVWDNMIDPERMKEFVAFMQASGFAWPRVLAPFSVYTQFICGILLIAGLKIRWAGAFIALTFLVGLYMVHWSQTLREWWPALALVIIGLHLTARGAGQFSVDTVLARRAERAGAA